ncbi:hypothetical protein FBZ98_11630 [Rhizobium sp. ERR 922]|nr:hypothetical protein FBZ98_11630 [Rhizobium sp. ERR 922]TWB87937.1 hypothetical protein FBZ97_11523 [Rhizobium sp. ERR 942]
MTPARYCARREVAWSWSVIDVNTGQVVAYSDVVLAGLGEGVAEDMARLLNLEYADDDLEITDDDADIPVPPRPRNT